MVNLLTSISKIHSIIGYKTNSLYHTPLHLFCYNCIKELNMGGGGRASPRTLQNLLTVSSRGLSLYTNFLCAVCTILVQLLNLAFGMEMLTYTVDGCVPNNSESLFVIWVISLSLNGISTQLVYCLGKKNVSPPCSVSLQALRGLSGSPLIISYERVFWWGCNARAFLRRQCHT